MPTSLFAPDFQSVLDQAVNPPSPAAAPFPSPEDWRDRWIYFLMLDRFNNPNAAPNHPPFDDPNFSGFQGGKFSGVQQQLAYIKNLGAGAIWLSPPLKNFKFDVNTYHGYGIHNFISAEPRFANNPAAADDELRALVDAAHRQDLLVIFDIVLNHTGNAFAYQDGDQTSFHSSAQPVQWRDTTGAAPPIQISRKRSNSMSSSKSCSVPRAMSSKCCTATRTHRRPPKPVRVAQQGSVTVQEVDGSAGVGPLHVIRVTLRPMEVQILRNTEAS